MIITFFSFLLQFNKLFSSLPTLSRRQRKMLCKHRPNWRGRNSKSLFSYLNATVFPWTFAPQRRFFKYQCDCWINLKHSVISFNLLYSSCSHAAMLVSLFAIISLWNGIHLKMNFRSAETWEITLGSFYGAHTKSPTHTALQSFCLSY